MRYAFFNEDGRLETAHNDSTIDSLPDGAVELSEFEWENRFELLLKGDELITKPLEINLENLAASARIKRNRLLAESDWSVLVDAPLDEAAKTTFLQYRQALRDIPEQSGFPENIAWPIL